MINTSMMSKEDFLKVLMGLLEKQGINYEGDLFRKPFYPQLKQEVIKSWQNLFRFHQPIVDALHQGSELPIKDIQAAIWKLPKDWIK